MITQSISTTDLNTYASFFYLDTFLKVLIYPLVSLIADIGGTLGLFVGFSFMTIWDGVEVFVKKNALMRHKMKIS